MNKEFLDKHYGKLIGKTVRRVVWDGEEIHGLEFTDGTIVWILQDEEGNGPGFLEIE